jgi:hypothetical protein
MSTSVKSEAHKDFTLVYAFGSGEKGQLGNGRTGEHIVSAGKTGFDIKDEPG